MERYSGIIPDYDSFLEYIERPLPVAARVNTVKAEVDEAVEAVENSGYEVERLGWFDRGFRVEGDPDDVKLGNTLPHYLGWIQVQEEVSMVPPVALGADDGDVVLDTCAAPGGKTTHIADDVGEDGFVVANDDNIGRIAAMRNNTDRLGLTNVGVTNYDARRFPNQEFDAVLVDAPCSSEGTVRKLPQYLDGASEEEIEAVTGVQKGILSRATELVADGGTVVYSTCTFAPEENEAVLDYVLENRDEETRMVGFDVGLEHSPGVTEWKDEEFDSQVEKAKRFYPHQNDTGGFFVAKMEVG